MKLPDGVNAVVDIVKLSDYCLSTSHPRGRHKARVFASVLGITRTETRVLYEELLRAARDGEAIKGEVDEYGDRYVIDFELIWDNQRAMVRSTWIVPRGERVPRLTSCYVL